MKLLNLFSGLLCISSAFAFKRPEKPTLPRAVIERSIDNQFSHPEIQKRASRFLTAKTEAFSVNGTGIPEVPFDIGKSTHSVG
jgi:carboxypeptidase D